MLVGAGHITVQGFIFQIMHCDMFGVIFPGLCVYVCIRLSDRAVEDATAAVQTVPLILPGSLNSVTPVVV